MKKTPIRFAFLIAAILTLTLLLCCAVYAVPAVPGSGHTGESAFCRSHPGVLVTLDSIPTHKRSVIGKMSPALDPVKKDIPLLIVVIGYNNMPYDNDFNWYGKIFNNAKSLSKYYTDMSFGQFTFTPVRETSAYNVGDNTNLYDTVNDGIVHVKLNADHDDWSLDYGNGADADAFDAEMTTSMFASFGDALQLVDQYIDLSPYDANNDGEISNNELALGFVVAGYEAAFASANDYEQYGGKQLFLWSHQYTFYDGITAYDMSIQQPALDGVTLDSYIAIPEYLYKTSQNVNVQNHIGTLAHELGHYLGLPDLYDTEYNDGEEWDDYEVEDFSLMAGGGWGMDENYNYAPYSLDIWSRVVLGWIDPVVFNGSGTYTITGQNYTENAPQFSCLKIATSNPNEYYLLENRRFTGWDYGLSSRDASGLSAKYGGGVILWHIDDAVYDAYVQDNCVNNIDHRPAIMPLFPELLGDTYSYIGNTDVVLKRSATYDAEFWENKLAEDLGERLYLPLYGTGRKANLRSARTLSDIPVKFLDDSALQMQVYVGEPPHEHTLSEHAAVSAKCEEAGRNAYWYCEGCHKYFSDAAAQNEVTLASLTIQPSGHAYGAWMQYSDTQHCRVCANDETHVEYQKHNGVLQNKVDATPESDGYSGDKVCSVCGKMIKQGHAVQYQEPKPVSNSNKTGCKLCGQKHSGFFGSIVGLFHQILYALGVRR